MCVHQSDRITVSLSLRGFFFFWGVCVRVCVCVCASVLLLSTIVRPARCNVAFVVSVFRLAEAGDAQNGAVLVRCGQKTHCTRLCSPEE